MQNKQRTHFNALAWSLMVLAMTSLLAGVALFRHPLLAQGTMPDGTTQAGKIFLPLVQYRQALNAWRLGFNVINSPLTRYADVNSLNAGWYADWIVNPAPPTPGDIEYVQTIRVHQRLACGLRYHSDRVACPYAQPLDYVYAPNAETILATATARPGSLWLIGNEMDRRDWAYCIRWEGSFCAEVGYSGQDEMLPDSYAVAFHELATLVRSADPTAKIGVGGVIQATPLRLTYLSMVWDAYQARYGEPMPVDVWNVHNFILQEEHNNWGADVPPGSNAQFGEYVGNTLLHLDLTIFDRQVRAFRQWMKERGEQEKPLIVSEYGVLYRNDTMGLPADDPTAVYTFMLASFDYFAKTRDCSLGFTADDCRLVQRWNWFSLDDNGDGFNPYGRLVNPNGAGLSVTGEHFREYVRTNLRELATRAYE